MHHTVAPLFACTVAAPLSDWEHRLGSGGQPSPAPLTSPLPSPESLPGGGWLVFPCHQIAADLCPDWDRGTQLDLISSWKIWHNCTSIGNANKVGCYWSRPQLSSWCSRSRPQLRKWSPAFPAPLTKSGFSLRNSHQNCWQALQYGVNAQFLLCFYQSR